MIAYKGFTKDLTAIYGNGIFQYELGKTYREEKSKTRSTGFHSAEYILDCLNWYPLNGKNRYFEVEAAGNIDEEEDCSMVVSTELTLKRELSLREVAYQAMRYMILHPARKWQVRSARCEVWEEKAEGEVEDSIVIARGKHPRVRARKRSILGIILENEHGEIVEASIRETGGEIQTGVWYTLTEKGEWKEIQNEAKED